MHFSIFFCSVVLTLQLHCHRASGYEYCSNGRGEFVCKHSRPIGHLACELDQVPRNGTLLSMYPMTNKLKRVMLHYHNERRNKMASGTEKFGDRGNFPIASRMRELIWDKELAYSAHIHAERCNMEHDKCHNNLRFAYAGQNLAYTSSNKKKTAKIVMDHGANFWYTEKDLIPDGVAMADAYISEYKVKCGHFTVMINDQVSRVGCALSYCTNCGKLLTHCYYWSCNYDVTNINKIFVYKTDPKESASRCKDWNSVKSTKYEHLCANTGEIFNLQTK